MAERSSKKRKLDTSSSGPRITDPRFANIENDPRYRLPSKKQKVKLDKRFSSKLRGEEFSRKSKVDRYGRKIQKDPVTARLKQKYDLGDEASDESDDPDDDDEVRQELKRAGGGSKPRDILREGRVTDSSSSSESSSDEDDSEDDFEEEAELAPQTKNEIPVGEVTSRLAVVNLDWDNIRAEDLMAVFSSFVQSEGKLLKVAVYPSEFGKERMGREEMEGPPKEIFASANNADSDHESSEDDDDEAIKQSLIKPDDGTTDFDSQALRRYQLDRLRYFYAVLTFSSPTAAKAIYDAVDGTEYLSTANFFDLRFIPDDTDFSEDTPRDECEGVSTTYKPTEFITDALQHSKVKLTWDAEDTNRKEAAARAFRTHDIKDLDDVDLAAYIGSDSSDNESVDNTPVNGTESTATTAKENNRQKTRSLLGLAPEQPTKSSSNDPTKPKKDRAPVGNVEITFSAGLTSDTTNPNDPNKKRSVFANTQEEAEETTIERYVRKEKERKERRRNKAKAARGGGEDHDDGEAGLAADERQPTAVSAAPPNNHEDADLGFDDPFFTNATSSTTAGDASAEKSKLRKEARLQKRKEREAEEDRNQKERKELELLMADDQDADGGSKAMRHFNMKEISKAQKDAEKRARKGKKGKKDADSAKNGDAGGDDGFDVDATADSRFGGRLFKSHEFAIDPSNPRYMKTKGMERVLEEGRRRRKGDAAR
ncbi:Pre-rRNA-processing protein esf1 [Cyphellophora attinorum]|uniref:Pre-rRNA-processing protein esf1 n=1 Tax=Cyphellophora attinorum TaxID=1664694 RepID=A0A0N1NVX6_9EURO|nr:Pre-rRNA-processing protein esf1 [Phialophora attinorum]KPI34544.1 Pre-rRNA-processing protein esf1 [Phialophora attinorum]